MRTRTTRIVIVVLVLVGAACGGDTGGIEIDGAWARTSPSMATAGAAYMDITAAEDDQLVAASVDASIAGMVEVHETVMVGDSSDDSVSDDDGGMEGMGEMTMQQVEAIELPAGATVSLEPGGYHIMMLDLAEPLEAGDTFDLTLTFANAGDQVVTVEVRDSAP